MIYPSYYKPNSVTTGGSSIFDNTEHDYAVKIKEIEQYYIKTLLTDPDDKPLSNEQSYLNDNIFYSASESSSIPSPKQTYAYYNGNDIKTNTNYNSSRINPFLSNEPLKTNKKANSLEVEINSTFTPSSHLLPLTTENLQRLTINETNYGYTTQNRYQPLQQHSQYQQQQQQQQQQLLLQQQQQQQQQIQQHLINNFRDTNISGIQHCIDSNLKNTKVNQNLNHEQHELKDPQFQHVQIPNKQDLQNEQPEVNKQLYKTELCESFTTKGQCKYGNKCQFAHGLQELKLKHHSNNYRTKPCINWVKLGYCPYGKRCCFKHGDNKDIQIYLSAGKLLPTADSENIDTIKQVAGRKKSKNLHANVKELQRISW